ncbi:MAG: hypothetical protein ACFFBT_16550 [Promethearchaeota archaeon]
MIQQFKVMSYILPLKVSRKDFQPYEFEEIINQYGIHYTAYLI